MTRDELIRLYNFARFVASNSLGNYDCGGEEISKEQRIENALIFKEARAVANLIEANIGQLGRCPAMLWAKHEDLL